MGRVALDPFEIETPDEDEVTRRALEQLSLPTRVAPPSQDDVEAQAAGDAYRAMPDAEADTIEGRSRDEGPGGRVYAAGDIPPSEPQRQRMMDRRGAREDATMAGTMAALDAPTDRQRPRWMRDREDPVGELYNDQSAQKYDLSGAAPSPRSAAPSTPAAGNNAAPPVASPAAGRDHTGADIGDAIQAAALMFGNILNAATGQQPSGQRFHSRGREEREQDRVEALASRQRGETMAARQAERDQALALQREGLDRTDARAQAALAQRAELAAQDPRRAAFQRESERLAALADPRSPATNALREQVRLQRDLLPGSIRNALGLTDERLASLDGQTLEGMTRSLPRPSVGIRGSGGGTGGPPRSTAPGAPTPAAALALANGMSEEEIGAFGSSPREQERLRTAALARGNETRTQERQRQTQTEHDAAERDRPIVPGWHQTTPVPLSAPVIANIQSATGELGQVRGAAQRMQELSREISILERAGGSARLTEAMGEARATHEAMSNALRRAGGYGVPNGTELERMESLAPRLDSVEGVLNANNAYAGILRAAERNHRTWMHDGYGFEPDGAGPRQAPVAPPRNGMVRMRTPNGRTIDVPEANAAEAERRGAVRQ